MTFAQIARRAGVHWTTVRRHVGDRAALRELIAHRQADARPEFADTRNLLLQAAARLVSKQGFLATSLDEIAAEAGLTKGAIYWHFSSKHELLLELMHETIRKQMRGRAGELAPILESQDDVGALADWLQKELPDERSDAAQAILLIECSVHGDPRVRAKLRDIVREIIAESTELIEGLQANSQVVDVDPEVVSVFVQALLNGLLLNWLIDPERVRPAKWTEQLARLLLYGLLPDKDD